MVTRTTCKLQFLPDHQAALVAGIAETRLEIIQRAGHNAPMERQAEVIKAVRSFMPAATADANS